MTAAQLAYKYAQAQADVELAHDLRLTDRQRLDMLDAALAINGAGLPDTMRHLAERLARGKVFAERLRRFTGVMGAGAGQPGRPFGGGGYLPTADEQDARR